MSEYESFDDFIVAVDDASPVDAWNAGVRRCRSLLNAAHSSGIKDWWLTLDTEFDFMVSDNTTSGLDEVKPITRLTEEQLLILMLRMNSDLRATNDPLEMFKLIVRGVESEILGSPDHA